VIYTSLARHHLESFRFTLQTTANFSPSQAQNHYFQHLPHYHLLATTTPTRHHALHLNPINIPTIRILGFRFFFPSQFRLTLTRNSSSLQPPTRAAELRYRPLPNAESAFLYGGHAYQQ
jgi:hypothetical protein